MKYYTVEEVLRKMEYFCAYQERSHYQVERKLQEYGMIPEARDYIILHLINNNFLNEERFARTYVRGKFYQKKWGKKKITQGLKYHRIQRQLIHKALNEISPEDYIKTIELLVEKKQQQIKNTNAFNKRQKIIKYLLQKGYDYKEFSHILTE